MPNLSDYFYKRDKNMDELPLKLLRLLVKRIMELISNDVNVDDLVVPVS